MTIVSKMVYEMIQFAETAIIMGYTTIESFVNYSIPENYLYKKTTNKGVVEIYDRAAIERNLSLSDKIKDVISSLYEVDNIGNQPFWGRFKELEKIRNSIVHSKAEEKELFHQLFDPNMLSILESVNELLDFFASCEKDIFPMSDINGKISMLKGKISVGEVKNMRVGKMNDKNSQCTFKELIEEYKNKE